MIKLSRLKAYLASRNKWLVVLTLLPVLLALLLLVMDHRAGVVEMGTASYESQSIQARCRDGNRAGGSGATHGESTRDGIKYNVRTPLNYDRSIAHPLLLVLSPAGSNRARTEKTTGLTRPATTAGFIVAYADHPELSTTTTIELGTIPQLVAKKWCIDETRIFVTGHSDGGTSAMALGYIAGTQHIPSAIAPSASGIRYQDLRDHKCPRPLPVMIMHSTNDRRFPGFGIEAVGWWAACNQCDPIPEELGNGCVGYVGCADGVKTWYCEGDKPHSQWPGINDTLIEFFASNANRSNL